VIEYRGAASTQLTPASVAGSAGAVPSVPGAGPPGSTIPGATAGAIVPGVAGGNSLRGRY